MATREAFQPDAFVETLKTSTKGTSPVDAASLCPCPNLNSSSSLCSEPLIHELVFSMLLWESTIQNAVKVMGKIHEEFVDYNELRVSFPHEIEALLGSRYQRGEDRSKRLIGSLQAIFSTYQRLTLEPLCEMSKCEAKDFLCSIETLPRFVTSRVLLLGLGAHAMPVDSKLARALHKADLIDSAKNPDSLALAIERAIRANQTLDVYTRMEEWLVNFESKP